jgi:hypothetical protein
MVAWHILHTDLPKRLGFVATFTCPWQPAWKHLSGSRPAYYNAVDADVEWRSMEFIEKELVRTGLWSVYERDVVDLEPILVHMQNKGMPVDQKVRYDRACKLDAELKRVKAELEALTPMETRRIATVYKKTPEDTNGLQSRRGTTEIPVCPKCGAERPRKDHFKVYKKKLNPCGGLAPERRTIQIDVFYRLAPFSPSRDQLIRIHNHLKRPLPTKWDSKTRTQKVSFGEEQIKTLILRYRDDKLYPLILDYRSIDKLAGTYVGRPSDA